MNVMTIEKFKKLRNIDFMNGAVQDEIYEALKQNSEFLEILKTVRKAVASLPADALGTGYLSVTLPSGESGQMAYPIRDELLDNINQVVAKVEA